MWEKIKKWFSFADLNKDGKISEADLNLAKDLAGARYSEAMEKINIAADKADAEARKRISRVKQEAGDVVAAVKEVVNQAGDVVAAVKGKERRGRKKK
jgi:hypothetical protein